MKCCSCAAEIEDGSRFCRECGAKQGGDAGPAPRPVVPGEQLHSLTERDSGLLDAALEEARSSLADDDARLCRKTSAVELIERAGRELQYLEECVQRLRRAEKIETALDGLMAYKTADPEDKVDEYADRAEPHMRVLAALKEAVSRQTALAEPDRQKLIAVIDPLLADLVRFVSGR